MVNFVVIVMFISWFKIVCMFCLKVLILLGKCNLGCVVFNLFNVLLIICGLYCRLSRWFIFVRYLVVMGFKFIFKFMCRVWWVIFGIVVIML